MPEPSSSQCLGVSSFGSSPETSAASTRPAAAASSAAGTRSRGGSDAAAPDRLAREHGGEHPRDRVAQPAALEHPRPLGRAEQPEQREAERARERRGEQRGGAALGHDVHGARTANCAG